MSAKVVVSPLTTVSVPTNVPIGLIALAAAVSKLDGDLAEVRKPRKARRYRSKAERRQTRHSLRELRH